MSASMSIHGNQGVILKLQDFSNAVQKRLIVKCGRRALKQTVAAARSSCPVDEGALKKSIGTKLAKSHVPAGTVVLSVGPRHGFEWESTDGVKHDPVKYGVPVEYGHVMPNGTLVPPQPYLRPAYESTKEAVAADFGEELSDELDAMA